MVMIEFKEAAIDKVFGLLEESFEHNKNQKMVLCELYDVLEDAMKEHDNEDEISKGIMGLRGSRSSYRSMRGGYRRGMHDDYREDNRYAY